MRDTLRLGLVLMLICVVTAGALAYVNRITKPLIAESKEKILQDSLGKAYPEADSFKKIHIGSNKSDTDHGGKIDIQNIYRAYIGDKATGFVAEVTTKGYSSSIRLLVGLDSQNRIKGVEVVEQSETPGLGTRVLKDQFRNGFKGLSTPKDVKVTKDGGRVDAITGATISSRAVSSGVSAALEAVRRLPDLE